ncbi:MAG: hypothetical protein U0441_25130 [Polyangiaceae bacterium]
MRLSLPVVLVLLSSSLLACSGNAVVEPAAQSSKRAKAFLAKCPAPADPPDDGSGATYKMIYACLHDELDVCPDKDAKETKTELGYEILKATDCGASVSIYDVQCGPDLNAVECCYAVRVKQQNAVCEY